ncbi:MAG: hypothetical protein A2189_09130 [Paenibacillus sp. RIFOXYA1_FULL_44_5]|nr:MAG: hypothetical protein A2189_09130 [Paenibacillus sp. RIFOXYA1_FULL_44_5]
MDLVRNSKTPIEVDRSNGSMLILKGRLQPETVSQQIKNKIQTRQREYKLDDEMMRIKKNKKLSADQEIKLRNQLQTLLTDTKNRLDEMSSSLQTDASYKLWVDSVTQNPSRLDMQINLSYLLSGITRHEKINSSYIFLKNGKK